METLDGSNYKVIEMRMIIYRAGTLIHREQVIQASSIIKVYPETNYILHYDEAVLTINCFCRFRVSFLCGESDSDPISII